MGTFKAVGEVDADGPLQLLSHAGQDFRCCLGRVAYSADGGLVLNHETALALGIRLGAQVRMVSARP